MINQTRWKSQEATHTVWNHRVLSVKSRRNLVVVGVGIFDQKISRIRKRENNFSSSKVKNIEFTLPSSSAGGFGSKSSRFPVLRADRIRREYLAKLSQGNVKQFFCVSCFKHLEQSAARVKLPQIDSTPNQRSKLAGRTGNSSVLPRLPQINKPRATYCSLESEDNSSEENSVLFFDDEASFKSSERNFTEDLKDILHRIPSSLTTTESTTTCNQFVLRLDSSLSDDWESDNKSRSNPIRCSEAAIQTNMSSLIPTHVEEGFQTQEPTNVADHKVTKKPSTGYDVDRVSTPKSERSLTKTNHIPQPRTRSTPNKLPPIFQPHSRNQSRNKYLANLKSKPRHSPSLPRERIKPEKFISRPLSKATIIETEKKFANKLLSPTLKKNITDLMNGKAKQSEATRKPLVKASTPQTRGEASRLLLAKNDILRRNRFLQKEIDNEKQNLKDLFPQNVVDKAKEENDSLTSEQNKLVDLRKKMASRLKFLERDCDVTLLEHTSLSERRRSQTQVVTSLDRKLDKQSVELMKLQKENLILEDRGREVGKRLLDATEEAGKQVAQRTEKDQEHELCMKSLSKMKTEIISQQMARKALAAEIAEKGNSLKGLSEQQNDLQEISDRQHKEIETLNEVLSKIHTDLTMVKREASATSSDLLAAQRLFRQNEEAKINMTSTATQTEARLVVQRDVAWIRVAEEEVVLSPRCGGMDKYQTDAAYPNLPVGATTPIFEVYNIGGELSPGGGSRNKMLVDVPRDSEFHWEGYTE